MTTLQIHRPNLGVCADDHPSNAQATSKLMTITQLPVFKPHLSVYAGNYHTNTSVLATSQCLHWWPTHHYNDVIMSGMASQITSLTFVYSTVYSGAYQRKHQSSASLAFVRGIHHGPVNSPHKWPVTWKMFQFDDVIMQKPHLNVYTDYHHTVVTCQWLHRWSPHKSHISVYVLMTNTQMWAFWPHLSAYADAYPTIANV